MLRAGKAAAIHKRIHAEALSVLAELFLVAGDMCAWLYTGSQVSRVKGRTQHLGGRHGAAG